MVLQQFDETLVRHSITPIPTVGEPFDPNLHEAVLQQPNAEMPPMTVLMEVEKGYKMHDRVVRPSKVIVSSAPAK
jgi:molecular chaperone GrpE